MLGGLCANYDLSILKIMRDSSVAIALCRMCVICYKMRCDVEVKGVGDRLSMVNALLSDNCKQTKSDLQQQQQQQSAIRVLSSIARWRNCWQWCVSCVYTMSAYKKSRRKAVAPSFDVLIQFCSQTVFVLRLDYEQKRH
jgi:hypothetical protein